MVVTVTAVLDANEILPKFHRWLHCLAYSMSTKCGRWREVDDLVQEGRIAMWRALATYDPLLGALATYLTNAARSRMADVVRRNGTWTGRPPRYGHDKGDGVEEMWSPVDIQSIQSPVEFRASDLAYHDRQIQRAINDLTPRQREYTIRRFWLDEAPKDLCLEIGNGWVGAKPKLRQSLRHLQEV